MNIGKKSSPKVEALYKAVMELLLEGREIRKMKVSEITDRAGIGKGTAYEYFESREELLMNALDYFQKSWMDSMQEEISKRGGFMEKISCLFDLLDEIMGQIRKEAIEEVCDIFFFSPIFRKEKKCGMIGQLYRIVEEARRGGELKETFPDEYIVLALLGRIFNYVSYCMGVKDGIKSICTKEQIKGYILNGIRGELSR